MDKEELLEDVEKCVQINENRLDRECITFPTAFLRIAMAACTARQEMDEAKANLGVVEANLGRAIRATPARFGVDKDVRVTEAIVAAAIMVHPDYAKAQQELAEASSTLSMFQVAVSAMEHKKNSLKMLVELHGLGWFAAIKVSKEGKDAVKEQASQHVRRYKEQ